MWIAWELTACGINTGCQSYRAADVCVSRLFCIQTFIVGLNLSSGRHIFVLSGVLCARAKEVECSLRTRFMMKTGLIQFHFETVFTVDDFVCVRRLCWHRRSSGGNSNEAERKAYKYNILSLLACLFLLNWENVPCRLEREEKPMSCVDASKMCWKTWWASHFFYSFIFISFASSVPTDQITVLMLQLINRTNLLKIDTIENVRVSCSPAAVEQTPIYMQINVRIKAFVFRLRAHTLRTGKKASELSEPNFFKSVCVRACYYCEHNFAFKQLLNGRMSETMAKAIELWP